jgi:hypothetical protein
MSFDTMFRQLMELPLEDLNLILREACVAYLDYELPEKTYAEKELDGYDNAIDINLFYLDNLSKSYLLSIFYLHGKKYVVCKYNQEKDYRKLNACLRRYKISKLLR